jgi:hypothetical protein
MIRTHKDRTRRRAGRRVVVALGGDASDVSAAGASPRADTSDVSAVERVRRADTSDVAGSRGDTSDVSPPRAARSPNGQPRIPITVKVTSDGLREIERYAAAECGGNVSAWLRLAIAEAAARRRAVER